MECTPKPTGKIGIVVKNAYTVHFARDICAITFFTQPLTVLAALHILPVFWLEAGD